MAARRLCSSVIFAVLIAFLVLGAGTGRAKARPPVPGASGYHLLKKIKLGGEGFWDYITFDSATRRLFISRGTKVVVLDVDSEKVVGEIPDTPGVHSIALVPDRGNGFTTNGRAGTVSIFDLKSLQVIGSVQAGMNPDAIAFDPASN